MNAIAELLANARATSQLKPKYHRVTSAVGMLAAFAGIALMYGVAFALGALLGLEPDEPLQESTAGITWIVLFFLAIPLSFLAAMVPVAWLCGHILVRLGYMGTEDVKFYALRSRYPAHWFIEGGPLQGSGRDAA